MNDVFCKEQVLESSWITKLFDNNNRCRSILDFYLNKQGLSDELVRKMNCREKKEFVVYDVSLNFIVIQYWLLTSVSILKFIKASILSLLKQ